MHARALQAGVDLDTLDLPDALALLFVWAVDAMIPHGGAYTKPVTVLELSLTLERRLWDPFWLTDETFGLGPTAEAGQAAMMGMFPTPAPRRPRADPERAG